MAQSDYDSFIQHLPATAQHRIFISDVQSLIDQQVKISATGRLNKTQEDDKFLEHYHKYDEIIMFMKNVSETYPDLVDLFTIGQTYEGRDIWGLTIKSKKARDGPTPFWTKVTNIFSISGKKNKEMELIMHGGQHAREWVSVVSEFFEGVIVSLERVYLLEARSSLHIAF